jgi:hypothetical protein
MNSGCMPPRRWQAITISLGLVTPGCNASGPQAFDPIVGNEPSQFSLVEEPEIQHHPNPDSLVVILSLRVADSTPHIQWVGTRVRIQSNAGMDTVLTAVPFACLQPEDGTLDFPLNFRWLSCSRIGAELDATSASYVNILEQATTGHVVETHPFLTQPGALLLIAVPVGQEATSEAVRRAQGLSYVRSAYRISLDPECVRSDVVPPPPCPPWSFVLRLPYAYGAVSPEQRYPVPLVPVRSGGWIRASYQDPTGATQMVEYTVP